MAHGVGRWFDWSAPVGRWGWCAGEILAGSAGSDAVTPTGATFPSWRVLVVAILHFPPRTGGNPRTRPGSSGVGGAFHLGGAAGYAAGRCHGVWWDEGGGRSGGGSFVLAELPLLAFISSFSLLGLLCRSPRQLPCDRVSGAL